MISKKFTAILIGVNNYDILLQKKYENNDETVNETPLQQYGFKILEYADE